MEYGVWNRDYDLQINCVDHLVAKRSLIHPRRQEREEITKKQRNSPPSVEPRQDIEARKIDSSVVVVCRVTTHVQEVLGSFSDSDVGAFVLIIL